jgi:hypothetical protein
MSLPELEHGRRNHFESQLSLKNLKRKINLLPQQKEQNLTFFKITFISPFS